MDLVFMDFVRVLVYEHAEKKENFANIQGMSHTVTLVMMNMAPCLFIYSAWNLCHPVLKEYLPE